MDWLPYYNDLKLGGHLACAFVASMLSGTLIFSVFLLSKDMRMFERSYAFALWTSALIWIVPMIFDVSAQTREVLFYAAIIISMLLTMLVFNRPFKKTPILWIAFLCGQILVFFMIYKKVF